MNIKTLAFAAAGLALSMTTIAHADDTLKKPDGYPRRPISFLVAYPPGGGMDITARTLAKEMERVTGDKIRVENRPGGGAVVGNSYLAKQAKPDGYTVGILANPTLSVNLVVQSAPFDSKDIAPVAGITFTPAVWLTNAKGKFAGKSFKDIIDYSKEHPNEVKVGVIPGSAFAMATKIVAEQTGAKFQMVPFQGGKPAMVALLGNNVDMAANYYSEVAQYVNEGQFEPLAISNNSPLAALPDTPTMRDLGIKMTSDTWGADRFVGVPEKTPDDIKAYLEAAVEKTLADPQTVEAFKQVGIVLAPKTMEQEQAAYDAAYTAVKDYNDSNPVSN